MIRLAGLKRTDMSVSSVRRWRQKMAVSVGKDSDSEDVEEIDRCGFLGMTNRQIVITSKDSYYHLLSFFRFDMVRSLLTGHVL